MPLNDFSSNKELLKMSSKYLAIILLISSVDLCFSKKVNGRDYYKNLPPVNFTLANAEKTDVIYKFFKNATDEFGTYLTPDNVTKSNLDATLPTILIIHGWTTDDSSPWFRPLKEEFFTKGSYNIIYVNWSKAGNQSYKISSANTRPIGKYIAEFLVASQIAPENIQVIGHSLGSQLCGFIGKHMIELSGKKLGRITALDPAGPQFEHSSMSSELKLSKDDALFVDVIHTDIQHFGYTDPIGHVDFYPNSGKHQPGCPLREINENCSHARSTLYFIESVNMTLAKAQKAQFIKENDEVEIRVNKNPEEVIFGQNILTTVRGVFYLKTNSQKTFLS